MTLYFGYGSNLCDVDWANFCHRYGVDPSCMQPLEPAWLPDMELVSNYFSCGRGGGVLNVQPLVGGLVPGVLFDVTEEGMEILRRKEGTRASIYEERVTTALRFDGSEATVTTFNLNPLRCRSDAVTMTNEYVAICRRGYQRFGLDERFLDAAVRGEHAPLLDAVFVYGTLMRGERRSHVVASHDVQCSLLAEAQGRLYDVGDFPGMKLHRESTVSGEFCRFADIGSFLADADRIEGFGGFGQSSNLFRRTVIEVHIGDGRVRQAWVYVLCRSSGSAIPSGSWRVHKNNLEVVLRKLIQDHAAERADFWQALHNWDTRFSSRCRELVPYDLERALMAVENGLLSERAIAGVSGQWIAGVHPKTGRI